MIAAINHDGSPARPAPGRPAICPMCKARVVWSEVAKTGYSRKVYKWTHQEPCAGPRDRWHERVAEKLGQDYNRSESGRLLEGKGGLVGLIGMPDEMLAQREYLKNWYGTTVPVVWIFDVRFDATCVGRNCPGSPNPMFFGVPEHDELWEMLNVDGEATPPMRRLMFRSDLARRDAMFLAIAPCHGGEALVRRGGELAGHSCRFANGRLVSFEDVRRFLARGDDPLTAPPHRLHTFGTG